MSKYTKIAYGVFFTLLLLYPHFIIGHVFSVPQAYVQSALNAFLLGGVVLVYYLNKRDITRVEKKKKTTEDKLRDAFGYIGKVNRQLPLLSIVTSDLLSKSSATAKAKREIFNDLLATAVTSIAKVQWGMFRFVDTQSLRTISEFVYTDNHYALLKSKISNKELLEECKQETVTHLHDVVVLPTSDTTNTTKCFFIAAQSGHDISGEYPVLQAIVDQAQIFFQYTYTSKGVINTAAC